MRRLMIVNLAAATILIAACVTINVYFPEAAAEKAADRVIDEVWGKQKGGAASSADKTTLLSRPAADVLFAAVAGVLNFVVPSAHAQANIEVSTPEIRAITASMETRHASLAKYYDSGAVGLTADGLIEIRDHNAVPLPERTAVRKLVADENKDRTALYAEIAKANGHPEWEKDIRATFAERWVARARAGWYYKDSGGAWKQK